MSPSTARTPRRGLPRVFAGKNGLRIEIHRLPDDAGQRLIDMYLAFQPRNSFQGLPPIKDEVCVRWVRDMLANGIHVIATHGDCPGFRVSENGTATPTGTVPIFASAKMGLSPSPLAPPKQQSSATPRCFRSTARSAKCWSWSVRASRTSASAPNWCKAASTWPMSLASSGFGSRSMRRTSGRGTSIASAASSTYRTSKAAS